MTGDNLTIIVFYVFHKGIVYSENLARLLCLDGSSPDETNLN